MTQTTVTTEVESSKAVAAKAKSDAASKKAKATAAKPAVKAKVKKATAEGKAKAKRKDVRKFVQAANNRALELLKEKDAAVDQKSNLTNRLTQSVALQLVTYRRKHNLTSNAMAEKLRINSTALSHLESGVSSLARLDKLVLFAKAMAIKPETFVALVVGDALS